MKQLLFLIFQLLSTIRKWKKQFETEGIDALQSKKKGRPSMKKESNKQSKQAPVEGSVEALQAELNSLKWKMRI